MSFCALRTDAGGPPSERLADEHRHDGRVRQRLSQAAIVTRLGLGANVPGDAIYPLDLFDDTGRSMAPAGARSIAREAKGLRRLRSAKFKLIRCFRG
jgi:hypothetical protein